MEFDNEPTKLEVLREINKRNGLDQLQDNNKLKKEYNNLEKGFEGEERLVHFLNNYGNPDWVALQNVWFDYYTEFESDLVLFTNPQIYTFEVKNYSGEWELKNGECYRNGHKFGHNPFSQAQKATTDLRGLLTEGRNPQNLQGVLAFTGIHNNVRVHDPLAGIDVRMLNELQRYIWGIVDNERNYFGKPIDIDSVLQTLSPFEIGKPSKEKEIPKKAKENVQKGIRCDRCGSFEARLTRKDLVCSLCKKKEPREEAIVRTICEYGMIHHEKDLKTSELTEFFNGEIARRTVLRYLKKHFKQISAHKNTRYKNNGCSLKKNIDMGLDKSRS